MTPEFVRDGKLTDDGQKLADELTKQYKATVTLGKDPLALKGADELTSFWKLVIANKEMSAEDYFTTYPHLSAAAWQTVMAAQPDDSADKARMSADDAEARHQRGIAKAQRGAQMAAAAAGESAPPLAYVDRLTELGENVNFFLEGRLRSDGLPTIDAVGRYLHALQTGLPLALLFQTTSGAALYSLYASADEASRAAAIALGRSALTIDVSKIDTPEQLYAEQMRVDRNRRNRLFVEVDASASRADVEAELAATRQAPDDNAMREQLARVNSPEELRALIEGRNR